jgi:integral membrane sensor domain MASE1
LAGLGATFPNSIGAGAVCVITVVLFVVIGTTGIGGCSTVILVTCVLALIAAQENSKTKVANKRNRGKFLKCRFMRQFFI